MRHVRGATEPELHRRPGRSIISGGELSRCSLLLHLPVYCTWPEGKALRHSDLLPRRSTDVKGMQNKGAASEFFYFFF